MLILENRNNQDYHLSLWYIHYLEIRVLNSMTCKTFTVIINCKRDKMIVAATIILITEFNFLFMDRTEDALAVEEEVKAVIEENSVLLVGLL